MKKKFASRDHAQRITTMTEETMAEDAALRRWVGCPIGAEQVFVDRERRPGRADGSIKGKWKFEGDQRKLRAWWEGLGADYEFQPAHRKRIGLGYQVNLVYKPERGTGYTFQIPVPKPRW